MKELVSIIITTYNRRHFIREAINSCLLQSYPHIEVIVVDDGSTDGTMEVLADLIHAKKIIYHYKKNAERAAARNTGMKLASGHFYKFLDSDDLIEKECISTCIKCFLDHKDVMLVHTNCKVIDEKGYLTISPKKGITGNVYEQLWAENDISLSSVIIKQKVFELYGGFDETLSLSGAEDWEYWIRLAKGGCIVGFVAEYVTVIRMHSSNGTMNDIEKILFSLNEARNLLQQKFEVDNKLIGQLESREIYLKAMYNYINNQRLASVGNLVKLTFKAPQVLFSKQAWMLFFKNFIPKRLVLRLKKMVLN